MDESGILRLLETIFPILIFLFWLVITFFANAKKGNQVPDTNNSPKNDSEIKSREKIPAGEELKRSLEIIFGGMGGKTEKPLPKTVISQKNKKKEESVVALKDRNAEIFKAEEQRERIQEQKNLEKIYGTYREDKIPISLSHNDLRKAVILSEILAPPVSIRDE